MAAGQKAAAKISVEGDAKTAAEEAAVNEELLKGLKKRFERSLPLKNINLVFIESSATKKQEEA